MINAISINKALKNHQNVCIQTGFTATSAKRGRSTGAEFGSTSAHQSCTTTASLASGHASHHVQDSHIDAPDLT